MMENSKNKHWWLYVLRLEQGKWYVGITSQTPERRLQEHIDGIRSAYWTQKYKPLGIELVTDLGWVSKDEAEAAENKLVRDLMKQRGYNNVRGGDLTSVEEYSIVFGRVMDGLGWQGALTIILLLLIIFYLTALLYVR